MEKILQWIPAEGVKILLVLFLSFLVGLEREERTKPGENYSFGGVRTFPLIGLIGYSMALLAHGEVLPIALGFAVVGAFLWLSYRHKLSVSGMPGATTEASALLTYLVGGLVYAGDFWIATTHHGGQHVSAGVEGSSRRAEPENPSCGNSDLHEISVVDSRHPAGAAEPGIWAVPD